MKTICLILFGWFLPLVIYGVFFRDSLIPRIFWFFIILIFSWLGLFARMLLVWVFFSDTADIDIPILGDLFDD